MNELHPGGVLFAPHGATPSMEYQTPWQMGIRADSIKPIGLQAKCKPVDVKAPHKKIDYGKRVDWNIHGDPERPKIFNMNWWCTVVYPSLGLSFYKYLFSDSRHSKFHDLQWWLGHRGPVRFCVNGSESSVSELNYCWVWKSEIIP